MRLKRIGRFCTIYLRIYLLYGAKYRRPSLLIHWLVTITLYWHIALSPPARHKHYSHLARPRNTKLNYRDLLFLPKKAFSMNVKPFDHLTGWEWWPWHLLERIPRIVCSTAYGTKCIDKQWYKPILLELYIFESDNIFVTRERRKTR